MTDPRPLIMHVVYRFDTGGLENGVVNLINQLPRDRFRHTIVALTHCAPAFSARIKRDDVSFIDLDKQPGHAVKLYPQLYRLFRACRPAIVHTRNLASLEAMVPAWLARVPVRIHGEHGWDVADPDGSGAKNRRLRKLFSPFVSHYVALSEHIAAYLTDGVGVPASKVSRICNGVDLCRFRPAEEAGRAALDGSPFDDPSLFVVGTVGRLEAVKDHVGLLEAFSLACARDPQASARMRLIIAGDGALRSRLGAEVAKLGLADKVWLAGARTDTPEVMRALNLFVLPSLAEGISNTILEAMASGLPVVATRVGGNPELVVPGQTGELIEAAQPRALSEALLRYLHSPALAREHGLAGRRRAEDAFGLDGMVDRYQNLYIGQLGRAHGHGMSVVPSRH